MSDSDKDFIAELLAEFVDQKRAGNLQGANSVLDRCPPEHREELSRAISFANRFEELPDFSLSKIGDYEVGREVGRGGMGAVFEARQISLNRKVALKVLFPSAGRNERALARFRREAQAAGSLQHPHIVPVYGIGEESGFLFYSMEFVEGPSLDACIEDWKKGAKRWTPEETAHFFLPLADAIDFAHRHGIVHRDIKPGNVLQSRDGKLRLVDFGLARAASQPGLTLTGDVFGTPAYMAPEQLRGDRGTVGPQSDIFSLGATLFEVLTLDRAFQGEAPAQILESIITRPPKSVRAIDPRIPTELETIVSKCLQKDPRERYASAADLARDLRRFAEGKPIGTKLPGTLERVIRITKHHPSAFLGATLALAALITVVLCAGTSAAVGVGAVLLVGLAVATGMLFERSRKITAEQERNEYDQLIKNGIAKRLSFPVFGGGYGLEMLDEMEAIYNRCIDLDPKRPEAFFHRAHIWDVKKRPDLVEADLDRAIALDPRFVPAYVEKALGKLRDGKLDEAQEALDPIRKLGLGKEAEILFAAFQAQEEFRFADAAQAFSRFIERNFVPYPEADYEFRLRRATARDLAGDHEGAKEDLLILQGRWGEKPELQGLMARAYLQSDRWAKFCDTIEKVGQDNLSTTLACSLDSICLSQNKGKEFLDWTEKQHALNPSSKRLLSWRTSALFTLSRGDEALHLMRKAVGVESRDGLLRSIFSHALARQELWQDAGYQSHVAVACSSPSAAIYGNQSYVFHQTQLSDRGVEASIRAASLDPHIAMIHVNLAANLTTLERWHEALRATREALRLDPFLSTARANLVFALLELREFQKALWAARDFAVIAPNSQEPNYWLGRTYLALGKEEEAWNCVVSGVVKAPRPYSRINYLRSLLLAKRGDITVAIDLLRAFLNSPITQHGYFLKFIGREECFQGLRGNPEFQTLLSNLENKEVWRKQELLLGIEVAKRDIIQWKKDGCPSSERFLHRLKI